MGKISINIICNHCYAQLIYNHFCPPPKITYNKKSNFKQLSEMFIY